MSKICEVCGKAPSAGRSISHSHRVTNRMFRPNVQKVTIREENGNVRKANVCTSCMKARETFFKRSPLVIYQGAFSGSTG